MFIINCRKRKPASKGVFWDEELQEDYEHRYLPLKESAISSVMKSLSIYIISGLVVAITESPRILSNCLASEKIFEDNPDVRLMVFYSPHGKVSVRRKVGTDIKCDMIARRLNGGGHSYAAAGIRVIKELQTIL
jgi:hypothetical protein